MQPTKYDTLTFPLSRVATFDVGRIGKEKHHMAGFMEIDVTLAKERIAALKSAGADVGFNAWILRVIALTIAQNRYIHAINYGRRKQIAFRDVDITVPIEKIVDGTRVPIVTVVRNANKKSVTQIRKEIHACKHNRKKPEGEEKIAQAVQRLFLRLPQRVRLLAWRLLNRNPFEIKKTFGTVVVTNVGTVKGLNGWFLPKSIHNLCLVVGTINKKPWVHNGEICIREILHLTMLVDHDVVDGAPAARFGANLIKNLENGLGLLE